MRVLNYRILLRKEPEGGYTVTVPSLPGCVTYGDKNGKGSHRESLKEHGEEIPTDEGILEYTLTIETYA